MATIKMCTDLSQSKVLAEILSSESADMCYPLPCEDGDKPLLEQGGFGSTPCWSLTALSDALPEINGGKPVIALDDNYITYPHMNDLHTKADNLVDACYEMILKLHERKLL